MKAIDRVIDYAVELNLGTDIEKDFDTRFRLQKITCLMSRFITGENYNFSLYIRGPYSPTLTKEYFDPINQEKLKKKQKSRDITGDEKEAIIKLKQIINEGTNNRLEIMATAYFLIKNRTADWSNLYETIKKIKPRVKEEDVVLGINDAKIWLITKEQWAKALEDLKEDMEFWDKASVHSMGSYLE